MTQRSRAREVTLQLLFQRDHNPNVPRVAMQEFVEERLREEPMRELCWQLYDGVIENLQKIDDHLTKSAENWRLVRMATVDRNVLRLATFELLYFEQTPTAVAFDEAIELAKRFGASDSPSFVNGILDRIRREALPK